MNINRGDHVVHPRFGVGTVVSIEVRHFSEATPRLFYRVDFNNTTLWIPVPIPETGGAGGPIIPVTGADLTQSVNGWFFGGFGMFGFGLVLSGLRKMFNL